MNSVPSVAKVATDYSVSGYVAGEIRRACVNLGVTAGLALGGVLLALLISSFYYFNYARGPFPIDRAGLARYAHSPDPFHEFVTVRGDERIDLGIRQVERRVGTGGEKIHPIAGSGKGGAAASRAAASGAGDSDEDATPAPDSSDETEIARYSALTVGDRILVVKDGDDRSGTTLSGALGELPADVSAHLPHDKAFRKQLLPLMLDGSDYRTAGTTGLVILAVMLALIAWAVRNLIVWRMKPALHPIARRLAGYGPLDTVMHEIGWELADPRLHTTYGPLRATRSWVFSRTPYGLKIARFDELAWIYQKVTTHYWNFILPIYKRYSAVLRRRQGAALYINSSKQGTEGILFLVSQRAPWAIPGYSAELERAWNQDRAGFLAEVDARRTGRRPADPPSP